MDFLYYLDKLQVLKAVSWLRRLFFHRSVLGTGFGLGPVHVRSAVDGRHWDVFPSGNFGFPFHCHSTNILYLLFIVILLDHVLLERKAGEAWDISKESIVISNIGDYLTEMNIHDILY